MPDTYYLTRLLKIFRVRGTLAASDPVGKSEDTLSVVPRPRAEPKPPPEPVRTMAEAMAEGYQGIPNVYLTRRVKAASRPWHFWPLYLILFSQWPLALNLFIFLVHRKWAAVHGLAMIWFAGFGLIVALMLVAADTTWSFVTDRSTVFDDVLADSPEYSSVIAWLRQYLRYRVQLLPSAFGAISGPIYLFLVRNQLDHVVAIAFPSYVLVSWTSFVGGNDLYWLWVATGLPKRFSQASNLLLRWQDPASTPGLRLLADAYGAAALFLLAGVISISVLGFVIPRVLVAPGALYLLYAFFIVAVFTSIRVAVIPMFWMWVIIVKAKRASLKLIDRKLPSLDSTELVSNESLSTWTAIYQTVMAAPALPFSTGAMVQYGAALTGSIFAFFIGLFTSR